MCTKTCGLCELSLTDEEIQAKFNFSRGSLVQEELDLDKLSTTRRVRSVSGSCCRTLIGHRSSHIAQEAQIGVPRGQNEWSTPTR